MFWLSIFAFFVILHTVWYKEGYMRENYQYGFQLKLFFPVVFTVRSWKFTNIAIFTIINTFHIIMTYVNIHVTKPNPAHHTTNKKNIYIYMKLKVGWKSQFHQKYYAVSFFWLNLILSWHFSSPLKFTFMNLLKLVHVTT